MHADWNFIISYTGPPDRMSHRKWRSTKQHPSRARAGYQISCCLLSLHFLSGGPVWPLCIGGYEDMRLRLARREFVPLKVRAMHLMLFCFLTETPEVPRENRIYLNVRKCKCKCASARACSEADIFFNFGPLIGNVKICSRMRCSFGRATI